MVDYVPHHAQPVTLAQLRAIEADSLVPEIARLENSIAHLERSNQELRDAVREEQAGTDVDEDAVREFEAAIKENEETIAAQQERITMIRLALEEKIGVDAGNPHYQPASQARGRANGTERNQQANGVDDAMGVQDDSADGSARATTASIAATGAERQADAADDGMYL
ncbi:hypothetical protein NBRC10512_005526 [Rhodotorula toruloides]|uniref:RHTO0S09e03444g1_1 n=2 Tax=Rhodotorula toruloides TaxID=5286 RepID=A0A061B4H0_RHOTO|nr:uncharacterized protein RHTO_07780 [Rhodotorula toruloides NP11]EMS22910.1 hypothetical protein RHTO_07780 [Rhodotorula toruloides NP11]CDR44391.1 RHTO0S09e03444g1_1 [Rhodotorula toruloides]